MNKIILHIPHAGTKLVKDFWDNVVIPKSNVLQFANAIADTKTDVLFGCNRYSKIKFKYSRIFCDVEKFADDKKEEMSKFGMGVVYTHTNKGIKFANVSNEYRNYVLQNYYWPYHNKMCKIVDKCLQKGQKVIMLDCHSFGKDIIMYDDRKTDLPDICIGYNTNYNKTLIRFINDYFINLGYKVAVNYPYSGTMVPNSIISKPNTNFASVMLEINKDAYLKNVKQFKKLSRFTVL